MGNLSLEQRVALLEMTVENQSKLINTLHGMIKAQQESLQNVYKTIDTVLELMKTDSGRGSDRIVKGSLERLNWLRRTKEEDVDPNKRDPAADGKVD